ncbi:GlsB/YeaQ/YmgE family stress response membrane protein [Ramlibacter sp. AW1]|uniref:GlsB/YeaQ/YmgE family stress response membrane protein n=1 Tax=Ramlibacter aurantiacus TaxID=2801330 RepID=A0A936ZP06_9BURK|nr:GlsB/YeaQ/YmgE family stress response membrane protein [Ramlibacter aurantiacus]MBL0420865.1 GlsB/YeaQ/YmgE family stress response membrane protein [Ramlibacter aurantiacus]
MDSILTHILGSAVIGLVVGLIARAIISGEDRAGMTLSIVLGIAGGVAGRLIATSFGLTGPYSAAGWVAAVLGAVLLLLLVGVLRGSRTRRR